MIKAILCLVVPVMLQAPTPQAPSPPKSPPAQPTSSTPKTTPPAQQTPPRASASRGASARTATLELRVTDRSGKILPNAHVRAEGGVGRDDVTDPSGLVTFRNLPAGVYRLHVENEGYVALEKEVTVTAGGTLTGQAALSAAPPPPAPPPAPVPMPAAPPPSPVLEAGAPKLLSIPDFVDSQRMGREGVKTSPIGCSGATQARMIQVRDPLAAHTHADADEILYDVAGDATIRMGGKDQTITSGWLVVVPRGTEHSVTRAGRNPVILVSIVGGPPCDRAGSN